MKWRIWLMAMVLLAVGCQSYQPTATLMTGPDLDQKTNVVTGRIGMVNNEGLEPFLEINYLDGIKESQTYAIGLVQSTTIVLGSQYIGGRFGIIDAAESGLSYSFIVGESIPIQKNIETVIEAQYIEYDREIANKENEIVGFAGLKIRFK